MFEEGVTVHVHAVTTPTLVLSPADRVDIPGQAVHVLSTET